MRAAVKQFIEETIDWIENDKWSDVAYKAESWNIDGRLQGADLIEFWKIFREDLKIDLFKFEDVEVVPSCYCYGADLEEVIIPEHILHISPSAFNMCVELRKIVLPKNLISIGNNAFSNTPQLDKLNYSGTKTEFKKIRLGWNAFGAEILGRNSKKLIAKDGVINL